MENSKPRKDARQRTRRQSRVRRLLARAWNEWRIEITIGLIVALAIFLLVERLQIRQGLLGWLNAGLQGLGHLFRVAADAVARFIQTTTLSDLLGYTLLLVALFVVLWRTRWRLMNAARLAGSKCPGCGRRISRIHRRWYDRLTANAAGQACG